MESMWRLMNQSKLKTFKGLQMKYIYLETRTYLLQEEKNFEDDRQKSMHIKTMETLMTSLHGDLKFRQSVGSKSFKYYEIEFKKPRKMKKLKARTKTVTFWAPHFVSKIM